MRIQETVNQKRFTVFSLPQNRKRGKQKMKNIDEKF